MNVFEIAEKYSIGIHKIKRMQRDGVLICDEGEGHPLAPAMRDNLRNKQDLSIAQLLVLIEKPEVFAELKTRQSQARQQVSALGDYATELMPLALVNSVRHAAENDDKSVKALIVWIKSVLPYQAVPYAFLGVRAAKALLPAGRADFYSKFAQALMNARRHPDFAGWFLVEKTGARKKTFYFRAENIPLDL